MSAPFDDALAIAASIRVGKTSALEVTRTALERIGRIDKDLNCFISLRADAALAEAAQIDSRLAGGDDPGPLAGVPFGVKSLFDVAGEVTLAGSKVWASNEPAKHDASAVARLRAAGAVLLGSLNMDEFALGFTTENAHYGTTRHPGNRDHVVGGSSGGSAAAIAAGLLPISLGSDTNGSIRVPGSLCGIFGLKPTYGRVSRTGVAALAWSFDHVGCFARSVRDLALLHDLLQGPDASDPACSERPADPVAGLIDRGLDGLRVGKAGGYFAEGGWPEVFAATDLVANALKSGSVITIPDADKAYAAALMVTSAEGASIHQQDILRGIADFDPKMRDRWIAASLIPATWVHDAQKFRRMFRDGMREAMRDIDVLVAPALPYASPKIGQVKIEVNGVEVMAKPTLGRFTAPISFIGYPVLSVPILRAGALPLGVQLIGKPFGEAALFRAARMLEQAGVVEAARYHV